MYLLSLVCVGSVLVVSVTEDLQIVVAETKWKGKEGHYYTTAGDMVIRPENSVIECGVGFIVDSTSSKAVIGYVSVSNRVMALRLASSPMNVTIIQGYASTSQYDEYDIEAFY